MVLYLNINSKTTVNIGQNKRYEILLHFLLEWFLVPNIPEFTNKMPAMCLLD